MSTPDHTMESTCCDLNSQALHRRHALHFPGTRQQQVVWATHYAPAAALFSRNAPGTAWKSKPSWYIVANNDRTVQPDLQRFLAKLMRATTHAADSSHVPMLSHPELVIDLVRAAAKTVQSSSATA
jgi:pimeloyl-ACP methyl ester carboxylesterase